MDTQIGLHQAFYPMLITIKTQVHIFLVLKLSSKIIIKLKVLPHHVSELKLQDNMHFCEVRNVFEMDDKNYQIYGHITLFNDITNIRNIVSKVVIKSCKPVVKQNCKETSKPQL